MTIREHDRVVLTIDVPEKRLAQGDIGTVVHVYGDPSAFEVEFVTLDGKTLAVVTLDVSQVRPISHLEIAHARSVA
jgi:ATP-dependent exoDNAse (exonuclease V) alpha subunit